MSESLFLQTSGIILSAGSSARMGIHKALLKFDADTTFVQKITETYLLAGIEQVIVVVNSELFELINKSNIALSKNVLLVINNKPELGRFYSLQTGIKHLIPGNSCFFQNIDNPFITDALLRELILNMKKADIILPAFHGRTGHPVLISSLVAQQIIRERNNDVRIDAYLKQFSEKKTEVADPKILLNINSPDEYKHAGFMA